MRKLKEKVEGEKGRGDGEEGMEEKDRGNEKVGCDVLGREVQEHETSGFGIVVI